MGRKVVGLVFAIVFLFLGNFAFAATAYDWLITQQNAATGLLDSYEADGSNIAYSYDQAVAIIAFTASNDLTRAKKTLDKLTAIQNGDGSWYFGYNVTTGGAINTAKDAGNNSWLVIAINYYTRKTGDTTYVNAAKKSADFFLTLQDTNPASATYGAIRGRPDVGWYSTEHNHDAYAALFYLGEILNNQYYKDKAQLVYNWLINKMWDNVAGRFYTGYNDYSKYLDPNSWAVPALGTTGQGGQDFKRTIPWIYATMHLSRNLNGQTIEGFDYDATLDGVWFEGTEQMALAYELVGDTTTANFYHNEIVKAQSTNGGIPCSTGGGGAWPTNMTNNSVAATSWFIFSSQAPRLNPFNPPLSAPDTTPPVILSVTSSNITADSATIVWTTDENSDSLVSYGVTTAYGNSSPLDTNLVQNHSVNLTGLSSATTYHFQVTSKDAAGNSATSADYSFITTPAAGQTKNYQPTGVVVSQGTLHGSYADLFNDDNIYMSVNAMQNGSLFYTDWYATTNITETPGTVTKLTVDFAGHYTANQEQGFYLYNYTTGVWTLFDYRTVGTTDQTFILSATDNANYISDTGEIKTRIYTERTDNVASYIDYLNFVIEVNGEPADTTPPVISNVASSNISTDSATITWTTDELSDSQVEYGETISYGNSSNLVTVLVSSHTANLAGLANGTQYHYRVKSKDAAGNPALSNDFTFTTASIQTKNYNCTGVTVTKGSSTALYSRLSANDSSYMTVSAAKSGNQYIQDWYAKTVIAESISSISKLTVTYDGRYSRSVYQGIYLYNFVTGVWARIDYRAVSSTDKTIIWSTVNASELSSYISSTGEIRMRIYTSNNKSHTCYADYVKFAIEYKLPGAAMAPAPPDQATVSTGEVKIFNNPINPSKNESAYISYSLAEGGRVIIKIYTIVGELLRTIQDEEVAAGSHSQTWNGKNNDGQTVASGIYIVHIEAPGIRAIKKIAVIK